MANTLTPIDVYALVNAIVSEATGRTDLSVVDTSSFVAVGETLLRTGLENTINAISTVICRTIFSVRPYRGSLDSLRVGQERWGAMVRKVVTLYSEAEASQDWNTDLNATQLADGNSIDMYKIKKPLCLQLNFVGTKVLQKHITMFRDQLALAFHDETEFARFIDAAMVQFNNEIELINENEARATVLNLIAGNIAANIDVVDLVAEYNTRNHTTLTRAQLLSSDYISDFMKFVAAQIKVKSAQLENMTVSHHLSLSAYAPIMRHTPKARQKMIMYAPAFLEMEAQVYSSLFNPQYLDIGTFEGVNFWQSEKTPTAINVLPNILNVSTGESQNAAAAVTEDYVLGVLFDEEACGIMPQFEYASTTPFNSAGGYANTFVHWRFLSYIDQTENQVVFVLGAGGE